MLCGSRCANARNISAALASGWRRCCPDHIWDHAVALDQEYGTQGISCQSFFQTEQYGLRGSGQLQALV